MTPDDLLRSEAEERVSLISGLHYDIDLDLTAGPDAPTFRSTAEVTFAAPDGASTFVNLDAASVQEIVLNGTSVDVSAFSENRIALSGLAASNTLRVVADCRYSHTGMGLHRVVDPADGNVYLYTQCEPFEAHRVFACFDQPDLKATFTLRVAAPSEWTVVSNAPVDAHRGARRVDGHGLQRDADHVQLPGGHRGRALRAGHRLARGRRAQPLLPPVAAPLPRRCRDLRDHQAGADALRQALQDEVPVRHQVRPALRARVQRRRDGERRVRHLQRGEHHLPRPGARDSARLAGRNDPPRDGAHVVRRPGDHALVGRPLAQRELRHVHGQRRPGGGHQVHQRLGRLRQRRQVVGSPAGPAPDHAPHRRRCPRRQHRPPQLRRHQLREGCVGAAPAGGVGRRGGVLRRRPRLLQGAPVGQRLAGRLPGPPRAPLRTRPPRVDPRMAPDGRA